MDGSTHHPTSGHMTKGSFRLAHPHIKLLTRYSRNLRPIARLGNTMQSKGIDDRMMLSVLLLLRSLELSSLHPSICTVTTDDRATSPIAILSTRDCSTNRTDRRMQFTSITALCRRNLSVITNHEKVNHSGDTAQSSYPGFMILQHTLEH